MGTIAELFRTGGILMYVILLVQFFAFPFTLILAALTWKRKHVPWVLWCIIPLFIVLLGTIGEAYNISAMLDAITRATPDTRMKLMAMGISTAQGVKAFSSLCLILLPLFAAFMLSIATFISTPKPRVVTTPGAALSGAAGIVTIITLVIAGASQGALSGVLLAIFVVGIGLVFMVLSHSPYPEDTQSPDRARLAASRTGVTTLVVLSLIGCAQFLYYLDMIQAFRALERATPATRIAILQRGTEVASSEFYVVIAGVCVLIVFGTLASLPTIKHAVSKKRVIISGVISAVFLGGTLLLNALGAFYVNNRFQNLPLPINLIEAERHTDTPTKAQLLKDFPDFSWEWIPSHGQSNIGCTLHYQHESNAWQIISNVDSEHLGHLSSCFTNTELSCEHAPGPVDGQICPNPNRPIQVLIQGDTEFSKFSSYAWHPTHPVSFLIGVFPKTEGDLLEIPSIYQPILSTAFSGVKLMWNPPTQNLNDYEWLLLDRKQGGYTLVSKKKRTYTTINDNKELAAELDALYAKKDLDFSKVGYSPGPDATIQSVVNGCLILNFAEQKSKGRYDYDSKNSTCSILNPSLQKKLPKIPEN